MTRSFRIAAVAAVVAAAPAATRAARQQQEGVGMVRSDRALSPELGPSLGRSIGITTAERAVSNAVGQETLPLSGRVPGYPQDMWMTMDEAVASPETEGLAPGWTGAMMGMMTTVRVLEPERYAAIMARVRSREGYERSAPDHSHHEG